ncbi:hypothetical protein [Nannocystis radixulma]|uniref:Uncharacterized protein n=1 Tax=Nannocystis radixulma TaxID=2995305 RepID=A0ABT5BK82_9BACT|nr:hypothetical protein [Nannocystis radixulma]MDC0674517.1 hypothetical protein [Nannocystis radixulma]
MSTTSIGASESGAGTTDDPTSGGPGVQVVVPDAVSLCANSHISTTVPEAFALNARLEIPAGKSGLGPRVEWPVDEDGMPQGPPPSGEDIELNATIQFPNTDAGMHAFGGGNWAAIQDRDVWGGDAPGLVWMSPAKFPTSESAPLRAAFLRVGLAGVPDAQESLYLRPPSTPEEAHGFNVIVGCDNSAVDACSIGTVPQPQGIGIELVPCDFGELPVRRWTVETARGTFRFEIQNLERLFSFHQGLALLLRVEGELDGQPFVQDDVMSLTMARGSFSPTGLGDSLGVLFREPLAGTCGVLVENLDFEPQSPLDPLGRIAYEITCERERGAAFEVYGYAEDWL